MLNNKYLLFVLLTYFSRFLETSACNGCVQLTELTFDKIISKFDAVLVKFDVAFPYGDKHEVYSELAKDAKSINELLVAEVGVKDYGERDNEEIAKRYGIVKDDYPVVKLFIKNKKEPFTFTSTKFTTEELRTFVKDNSGIHLSLPGCLSDLDKIAFKFMKAKDDERKTLLKKLEGVTAGYTDKQKKSTGKVYQLIMQRIIEKGDGFVSSENERVKKLLDGKISPDKKIDLNSRLNILSTFAAKDKKTKKDEF